MNPTTKSLAMKPILLIVRHPAYRSAQSVVFSSCIQTLTICLVVALGSTQAFPQVVRDQVDDFEDGTTQGWREGVVSPNPPTNIADGGPNGVGDNYMSDTSAGGFGAGSNMTIINTTQWLGNYLAPCINEIQADARVPNTSANSLNLRFGFQGSGGTQFVSTNSVPVPVNSGWIAVTFPIRATDLTRVQGTSTYAQVMAAVDTVRIVSAAGGPAWRGDTISATVHLDNIRAVGPRVPGNGDLNANCKTDILWRNGSTGQNWAYLMNGSQIDNSLGINTVPTVWQIVGNGDYDGDGDADILWRNNSTGQNWMYLIDSGTIDSSVGVNNVPGPDWQIVGNGDYDGNGKADILWRNGVSGQNWIYLMNGALIVSSVGVNNVPGPDWQIVGNGDYDGNGTSDILWRNSVSGQNWMYLMNGATIASSVGVNKVAGPDWQIVGNGDYDGNGTSDILWRNSVSGQNWMYLMNGATISSSVGVNSVPVPWQIVGDGDYNGDGKSDILWRNGGVGGTGQNWLYLMTGATINQSLGINTVSDLAWEIVNTN